MREGQSGLVTALASSGVWVRKEVVMSRPREPASAWGGDRVRSKQPCGCVAPLTCA